MLLPFWCPVCFIFAPLCFAILNRTDLQESEYLNLVQNVWCMSKVLVRKKICYLHHILAGQLGGRTSAVGGWHWGCPADNPRSVAAQWSCMHFSSALNHPESTEEWVGPVGERNQEVAQRKDYVLPPWGLPLAKCVCVYLFFYIFYSGRTDLAVTCCKAFWHLV